MQAVKHSSKGEVRSAGCTRQHPDQRKSSQPAEAAFIVNRVRRSPRRRATARRYCAAAMARQAKRSARQKRRHSPADAFRCRTRDSGGGKWAGELSAVYWDVRQQVGVVFQKHGRGNRRSLQRRLVSFPFGSREISGTPPPTASLNPPQLQDLRARNFSRRTASAAHRSFRTQGLSCSLFTGRSPRRPQPRPM